MFLPIMFELKEDLLVEFKYNSFWYPPVYNTLTKEYKKYLTPRIDHLKRTIARLEKEIETATIN